MHVIATHATGDDALDAQRKDHASEDLPRIRAESRRRLVREDEPAPPGRRRPELTVAWLRSLVLRLHQHEALAEEGDEDLRLLLPEAGQGVDPRGQVGGVGRPFP